MSKDILFGTEAREKIKNGLDKVANAVAVTLGPRGRNVIIRKNWGMPDVTKDGVTVAKEITLKDHYEDTGAQLCKQVASKTNDSVGDGTTTATILAQALIKEGLKYISTGANAISVKKGIDRAAEEVLRYIDSQKQEITYGKDLEAVATISGNDSDVGKIVSDAFTKVGPNGIVTFEDGKTTSTTLEISEGFEFDRGYIAPHFVTDPNKMRVEYNDCLILFWDKRITSHNELVPLLNSLVPTGKPLVIIADEVETEALAVLVINYMNGRIKVVAIKAPGFGERKKALMADMALFTKGEFITEEMGMKLEKVSALSLGSAKRIIVTKDTTTIIGGAGAKEDIEKHVEALKVQADAAESTWDKEKLNERIAKLSGAVATIKIGASVESELNEKKYRFEDAICATKAALEQGVVPGGGITLYKARKVLAKLKTNDPDEAFGISIVSKALEEPINRILANAGYSVDTKNKIFNAVDRNKGYDGKTGKVVLDMVKAGITDPVKVVKSVIQSSTTVAGLFLTVEAMIIDTPSENKSNNNPYAGY